MDPRILAGVRRFVALYVIWLVLSGGRGEMLLPGAAGCLLVTAVSIGIWRGTGKRVRPVSAITYMPGFLWRSFKGGVDVAWRVMGPTLRIAPAFVSHDFREEDETAQVVFCDAISLMPGTLACGMDGPKAEIHLLADEPSLRQALVEEEERVRGTFGQGVETAGGASA